MKHIPKPSKMNEDVLALWKKGRLHGLKPEGLAEYVGVSFKTVYCWFIGQKPFEAQKLKIREAIKKIEADFPDPLVEKEHQGRKVYGLKAAAWAQESDAWPEGDPRDPAVIEVQRFRDSIRPLFYRLQRVCSESELPLVVENWPGFVEILGLLKKYDIGVPRRRKGE
jgi:hypothetical protein